MHNLNDRNKYHSFISDRLSCILHMFRTQYDPSTETCPQDKNRSLRITKTSVQQATTTSGNTRTTENNGFYANKCKSQWLSLLFPEMNNVTVGLGSAGLQTVATVFPWCLEVRYTSM